MANFFLDDGTEQKMLQVKSTERGHSMLKANAAQAHLLQGEVIHVYLSLTSLIFQVYVDRINTGEYPSYYRLISPLYLTAVEVCCGLGLLDASEKQTVLAAAANLSAPDEAFRMLHGVLTPKMPAQRNVEKRRAEQGGHADSLAALVAAIENFKNAGHDEPDERSATVAAAIELFENTVQEIFADQDAEDAAEMVELQNGQHA